tara:strand:+ start:3231 stop:3437 length:207 start_codon:yes stop_codon:yes gene_type:complete
MNSKLRNLEEKIIECITDQVDTEVNSIILVSVTLSAILIKINKSNGMAKEDFIELMEKGWDGIKQEMH